MSDAQSSGGLPPPVARGKVRDIYDLGDRLLFVATDRISAFDVVMNEPVPGKGVVLTQLTAHWLRTLPACSPHHLDYVVTRERVPAGFETHRDYLAGRAMVVRRAQVLPIECVVRGYLVGGGWKDYIASGGPGARGSVSGVSLPAGLQLAGLLPQPIFTPSTKAATGHDEPISFDRAVQIAAQFAESACGVPAAEASVQGRAWVALARDRALAIYQQARDFAAERGIIIADTKFEFGVLGRDLILVDEVLTPDSSRFWPAAEYSPGSGPPSFDKQFLRDYLETTGWNKRPPPPPLPADVIEKTAMKYREALERLRG